MISRDILDAQADKLPTRRYTLIPPPSCISCHALPVVPQCRSLQHCSLFSPITCQSKNAKQLEAGAVCSHLPRPTIYARRERLLPYYLYRLGIQSREHTRAVTGPCGWTPPSAPPSSVSVPTSRLGMYLASPVPYPTRYPVSGIRHPGRAAETPSSCQVVRTLDGVVYAV